MNALSRVATFSLMSFATAATLASQSGVEGSLASQNDVVRIGFHLDADSLGVKL